MKRSPLDPFPFLSQDSWLQPPLSSRSQEIGCCRPVPLEEQGEDEKGSQISIHVEFTAQHMLRDFRMARKACLLQSSEVGTHAGLLPDTSAT